mmetsp:Transcript_12531/g.15742  ORF Transcript_12531/g.15742 Transcript_12531/m.15742 type:complete len:154 (-) Transcript_12531:221-682(-)|eukprot:CAMPEP_0172511616 /NCGR_PEP_ID=MMETSP1066-20121228/237740_1 /TAXON_ID=671091 /ORGANISM="Coscinodiscus wailesii, Strain CCMP2513" /LENGTH=153 /DNA_ID=CAMNT_0013291065 /DNA_START=70 /DNA_END=531 /DNA_ORIENTATION=-
MAIDRDTIAVVKQTWSIITTTSDERQLLADRLMLNYLRVVPSARYIFPTISEDGIMDRGLYLVSCIDRVVRLLDNQNDPRFKAVLKSYGRLLMRYYIDPTYYDNAWLALIETLQDVMGENFSELMFFYWIDIMDPLNQIMKSGVLRNRRDIFT